MNTNFTKQILELENLSQVERALCERRDEILTAIAEKRVPASLELMKELAELNIAIGDVDAAPLQEDTEDLHSQNARLRQRINQVADMMESIMHLEEKIERLVGGQP